MNIRSAITPARAQSASGSAQAALPLPVGSRDDAPDHVTASPIPAIQSLEKRRLQCYIMLMLADMVAILSAFAIVAMLHLDGEDVALGLLQAQFLLPVYLTAALYNGIYWFG